MLFLIFMIGLNMAQLDKDISRCKKVNHEAPGCSLYKKLNVK